MHAEQVLQALAKIATTAQGCFSRIKPSFRWSRHGAGARLWPTISSSQGLGPVHRHFGDAGKHYLAFLALKTALVQL